MALIPSPSVQSPTAYVRNRLNKRSAEEIAASKTPSNYDIQPQNPMPLRFGATGDDVANDTTAIADTAAAYAGKYVDLGGRTYKVTAIPTGFQFFNGTLDISGSSDDNYLNAMYGVGALASVVFDPYAFPSSTLDFAGGNYNCAFGPYSQYNTTSGRRNSSFGSESMYSNTTGAYSCSFGAKSMYSTTTGQNICSFGVQNLQDNTTGSRLSSFGSGALLRNSTGDDSAAFGFDAGANQTTADRSSLFGTQAGLEITTGDDNSEFGYQCGSALTTGIQNCNFGSGSMSYGQNVHRTVTMGYRAAQHNTASNIVAIGADCLILNEGGTANVGIGYSVLDACVTGVNNTGCGDGVLGSATGSHSSGFGKDALLGLTSGALASGFGYSALSNATTETNISGLGYNAQITGSNQVQLGDSNTSTYAYGAVQNRSDIRDKADVDYNGALGLSFVLALKPVAARWDMRDDYYREWVETVKIPHKEKVVKTSLLVGVDGRNFVKSQEVETVREKQVTRREYVERDGSKKRKRLHQMLIAQDVKEVCEAQGVDFGGLQHHEKNGGQDVWSIGYTELVPPLINAVKQLAAKDAEIMDLVKQLLAQNAQLSARLAAAGL